jgi:hypothetical protein
VNDIRSALVILGIPGGGPPKDDATVDRAVHDVTKWFRERGFEVGGVVGPTFPILGPRTLFVAVFGTDTASQPPKLDTLPLTIAKHIDAVVFTPPTEPGAAIT